MTTGEVKVVVPAVGDTVYLDYDPTYVDGPTRKVVKVVEVYADGDFDVADAGAAAWTVGRAEQANGRVIVIVRRARS